MSPKHHQHGSYSPHAPIRFLGFGLAMGFFSTFGQTYFIGALQPFISAEYGWNAAEFGRIYLAVTLASFFGINMLGHLVDRWPLRPYVMIINAVMLLALTGLYALTPVVLMVMALMAVRLVGQGLIVHTAFTSMGRYFEQWRGRAIAVANAGISLGQASLPPLAIYLCQSLNWRAALLWLGIGITMLMIPLLYVLLAGHDKRHRHWLAHQQADTQSAAEDHKPENTPTKHLKRRDALTDPRFYMLIPMLLLGPFWVTAVFFFADKIAEMLGLSLLAYSAYYLYFGVGGALIPFLGGWLVDRHSGQKLIQIPILMMLGGLTLILLSNHPLALIGYFLLIGSGNGFAIPVNNALWAELYGTRFLGEIKSLTTGLVVLSTAMAPMIVGELMVAGYDISSILWAGVVHAIIAIPLTMAALRKAGP